MAMYKRSKTNEVYFKDIPKPLEIEKIKANIFKLLKEKNDMRARKSLLNEQQRETRKTIYNMALRLDKLDVEIEELMIKGGF